MSSTTTATVPAQRTETTTPPADVTTTAPVFYSAEKWTPEAIAADLRKSADAMRDSAETFGYKIVEAYVRETHKSLGQSWKQFTNDVLAGFKPDTRVRSFLVSLMSTHGMDVKATADALKISERTAARERAAAGQVNKSRQENNRDAANANAQEARDSNTVATTAREIADLAKRKTDQPMSPADVAAKLTDDIVTAWVKGHDLKRIASVLSVLTPQQRHELSSIIAPVNRPKRPAADTVTPESRAAQSDAVSTPVHPDANKSLVSVK